MRIYPLVVYVLIIGKSFSQSLTADFVIPSTACQQQNIVLMNQSFSADRYEWDLCQGDLSILPTAKNVITVPGGNITIGIDVLFDGTNWFGFMTSRETNSIKRLDFGTDIYSTPTIVDLGNIGGLSPWRPADIHIVNDNGEWFGFVYGESSNVITRIDFGTSLSNTSTLTSQVIITGSSGTGSGMDIVRSGSQWMILYSSTFSLATAILNTVRSIPTSSEKMQTANLPGVSGLGDVKLLKYNNDWHAYIPDFNASKFFHVKFGSDILSNPTITDLSGSYIGSLSPYGLDIGIDQGDYIAFLCTLQGSLIKIDLGDDLDLAPVSGLNIGNLSTLGNTLKMVLVKEQSNWIGASVSWNGGEFLRIDFSNPTCTEVPPLLREESPIIQFLSSGTKYISLRSFNGNQFEDAHNQIVVNSLFAPSIDFSNNGICYQTPIQFSLQSDQTITSSSWDFGEGNVSSMNSPINTFTTSGTYRISLEIVSQNGCSNVKNKSISIFIKPIARFTLPSTLICTNNAFTFTNTTTDNFDGNLSYQWLVDNVPQSTSRDLKYAFTSGGSKEVKLITSIPGCSDENVQVVSNVLTGPTVGFSQAGQCETDQVSFTNTSSGSITGYLWDFGNGNTSTQLNPTQTYITKGSYNVSLKTTASNSCESIITKPLTIYSKPTPNFSLDLPPFSCSGTPSQFNDLTPSPTDSNLATWAWNFGDAGTSTDRNPLHTFTNAGDYNVSLTATTNFGCTGSFQKSVNIAASPPADFTYNPACINQGTRFADASGAGVKSWFWTIGSSTYAFSNPTHVFNGSGNYSAKLTVTGNNNCVATVTKTINVPVAPSLNFSVDNACETQPANFKDTSPVNIDPTASWAWDFAGQGTSTGSATQYSFAKAGSYSVKMTSTQQSGCVYSLSKNVAINATPVAAFTSSPEWGVPPLSVQFTNTSTGASSYSWHFNDKNNSMSTQTSPGFQFTELGDYVVDLVATSALGCSSFASGKISVIIPSLDLELKQLQLVKDPTSNAYRIFVTVKNKSNYLLTSVDVVVDISGNALIKETINTNLLPDAEIVQLLNNQILPHGNLLTYLCASIEVDNDNDPFNNSKCEPIEEETVVFAPYPNPSNGSFRFEWISPTTDNAHFEIFNSMGQLTFEQYAEAVQVGLNQVQFGLSNLNTGAYYFRFTSNSVSKTLPIQIVR